MSVAGSFDPDGPACSDTPTTETLETPDESATLTVPPGAVDEPTTISITGLRRDHGDPPPGRELFLKKGGGTVHTGLLPEPEGHIFDPYLTLCLQWEDADDDGVIDGTNLDENLMKVMTKQTVDSEAGRLLCSKCDSEGGPHGGPNLCPANETGQIPNGETGWGDQEKSYYNSCTGGSNEGLDCKVDGDCPDGTCETLRCCCDLDYNRYCLEIAHFSAYGIGQIDCSGVSRPQVLLLKLDKPAGEHKAKIAGNIQLPIPIDPELDPLLNGVRLAVRDNAGNAVIDVEIPGGAFDKATKKGWKRNGKGNVFKWTSKTGIDGIIKVLLREGSPKAPGLVKFLVGAKNGSFATDAANLPLNVGIDLGPKYYLVNQCGEQTFEGEVGRCYQNSKGSMILCR